MNGRIRAIIRSWQGGNDEIFDEIYEHFDHRLFVTVHNLIREYRGISPRPEDVEDLCMDVWETVFQKRSVYDETRASFFTWMYGIAFNKVRNHYRRRATQNEVVTEEGELTRLIEYAQSPTVGVEDALIREELYELVRKNIQEMDEQCSQVLSLRYIEGRTDTEIASLLDIRHEAVRKRLSRCRRKLRTRLQQMGWFPEMEGE
jgi:RNA polymerase sigma factor (sigma-70 family)